MKKYHHTEKRQLHPTATGSAAPTREAASDKNQLRETRELVQLVKEAADLLHVKGGAAFTDFRVPGSRWRQGETYIFVLDPEGYMLVHADSEMEGKNQLELQDVNGKPIIRGLINAATSLPDKPEGWYHYEWPVPGGLLPRWKSSYVRLVKVPSGKSYIVGSGMYNDRMEREFVVDLVQDAIGEIEKKSEAAFQLFHDPTGPFMAKDAYIFVYDLEGVNLVLPAFPSLEGRNLMDMKDINGKQFIREMVEVVQTKGSGWVDYMWPKPGESVSTEKSAYVSKARVGDKWVLVGCGVYLADSPKASSITRGMTAPELVSLVGEAAAILEQNGENAFPAFRQKGSKWLHDDIYFWVWSMDGVRVLHGEIPAGEGKDVTGLTDPQGKPIGKIFLELAASPEGEGWLHCMWPKPYDIFPAWKSCFVKRVTFPSGKQYLVGSGIYNMQMDRNMIEDVVSRAAALVAERGKEAFPLLRDKTGPFYFMDTYVFVQSPDGTELVNPAQPSLEGRNLMHLKDLRGKEVIKEEIAAAMKDGSAWLSFYWYKPGDNTPALKQTFVQQVQHDGETYVVGSGLYEEEELANKTAEVRKVSWETVTEERMSDSATRQTISGNKATLSRFSFRQGARIGRHSHPSEEYMMVTSGAMRYTFDDEEIEVKTGEVVIVPPDKPHSVLMLENTEFLVFFAPPREDWLRGEDQYLRMHSA